MRAFRKTVEKRTTREYLPHAQQLYAWLIRPLEPDLASFRIDTLVFVPDRPLRTVPMAALHDGRQFLIEKFALATTPGLSLSEPKPIDREKVRLLSGGLTKAVQGFPSLPFVEEEINALRTLYQVDQLLNAEFSAPRLEQTLHNQPYGILHIATHGWFAADTTQSYLLTYNGKLTIDELDHLIGLFRYRKDPLELLTLSACQTGTGDDRSALGLAGVAIKAGARSALATFWFINDEASAALVSEFYRELRNPKLSKAQALARKSLGPEDKEKVLEHLRLHPKNRPVKRKTLVSHITSLLGGNVAPKAVRGLIAGLENEGVVKFTENKIDEYKIPKHK